MDIIDISNPRLPKLIESFEFPHWDINAVAFHNSKILLAGQNDSDGAFFAAYSLKGDELFYSAFRSFSANSMKIVDGKVFITSGDLDGGLTILDGSNFSELAFISVDDARSVAGTNSQEAYMLKAGGIDLYSAGTISEIIGIDSDFLQEGSKAELDISNDFIFAAVNRGGTIIWDRNNLSEIVRFSIPTHLAASDPETYVSNSVSFNEPLLFVANGGSGIMVGGKDINPQDEAYFVEYGYFDFNKLGGSASSNFVKSAGNVIFVASGLGGLKILTIEKDQEECTWTGETAYAGAARGKGNAWWYYFDNSSDVPQPIYAGQKKIPGAFAIYENGVLRINLGKMMKLRDVDEAVKIQGYDVLPSSRPASGRFETYKGTELIVSVPYYPYYVIHLDVDVCQNDQRSE